MVSSSVFATDMFCAMFLTGLSPGPMMNANSTIIVRTGKEHTIPMLRNCYFALFDRKLYLLVKWFFYFTSFVLFQSASGLSAIFIRNDENLVSVGVQYHGNGLIFERVV